MSLYAGCIARDTAQAFYFLRAGRYNKSINFPEPVSKTGCNDVFPKGAAAMKRLAVSILCLVLCLTACAEKSGDAYETDWTVRQMAQAVWNAGSALDGTEILPGGEL